jgi:4-diphosphocytidyl-2C-methyl-D-erythritol kinase
VSGITINSGGAANTMGGGRAMLTLMFTAAIVGIGTTLTNAKSIVPKSNFFILLPPCCSNSAWVFSSSATRFRNAVSQSTTKGSAMGFSLCRIPTSARYLPKQSTTL